MTAPDHEQAERELPTIEDIEGILLDHDQAERFAQRYEGFFPDANAVNLALCYLDLAAQLAERERALREIADPSYVGNYSPEEVVSIYRKWALAATHSDSEASE